MKSRSPGVKLETLNQSLEDSMSWMRISKLMIIHPGKREVLMAGSNSVLEKEASLMPGSTYIQVLLDPGGSHGYE